MFLGSLIKNLKEFLESVQSFMSNLHFSEILRACFRGFTSVPFLRAWGPQAFQGVHKRSKWDPFWDGGGPLGIVVDHLGCSRTPWDACEPQVLRKWDTCKPPKQALCKDYFLQVSQTYPSSLLVYPWQHFRFLPYYPFKTLYMYKLPKYETKGSTHRQY